MMSTSIVQTALQAFVTLCGKILTTLEAAADFATQALQFF